MTMTMTADDRRHATNAWLCRTDLGRWEGDDGSALALDQAEWPSAARDAYAALVHSMVDTAAMTVAEIAAWQKGRVANKRWRLEIGGLTSSELTVATDDRSKLLLAGAREVAIEDPDEPFDVKLAGGSWVALPAASVPPISLAIGRRIRWLFRAERAHSDAIDALAAEDNWDALRLYDVDQGWPA